MTRRLQYLFLMLLVVQLIWRGLIPSFTVIATDFPNYYVSARLALDGNFDRVYDDDWFQTQIHSFGIKQMGKFSPYPPVTAFVAMPLTWLSPLNALRAWSILNLAVLGGLIILLSAIVKKDWLWSSLVVLLSGHALANNFRFGQFYLILSFLTMMAFYFWQTNRKWSSGALLGLGAVVKYFPLVLLPLSINRREWRIAASLILTIVLVLIGSTLVLGLEPYRSFVSGVLFSHLSGNIQDPFNSTFQSWNSLFRRLMIFDPVLNPKPLFNSPFAYSACLGGVYTSVVALVIFGIRSASLTWKDDSLRVEFALACIGGILLFPASATYHFLLLIFPIAILLTSGGPTWTLEQKMLALFYVCVGFLPYSLFRGFDGKGFLTFLAYPRLFLTTMILGSAVAFVVRSSRVYSHDGSKVQVA